MDKSYKCLSKQRFEYSKYSIVPIRYEDRFKIMQWRNEQIYHLRQKSPLTPESQTKYFNKTISYQFQIEKPTQILFSFLKKNELVGYGGLVHIDWGNHNAEISFLMDTKLEINYFVEFWSQFINLITLVAFNELNFNKIYVYAYDLRPKLYMVLKKNGFVHEARLQNHIKYQNRFIDVIINSRFNSNEKN